MFALAGLAAAAAICLLMTPTYTATTRLFFAVEGSETAARPHRPPLWSQALLRTEPSSPHVLPNLALGLVLGLLLGLGVVRMRHVLGTNVRTRATARRSPTPRSSARSPSTTRCPPTR